MRVKSMRMQKFRSFVDSGDIEFDAINVLIGANNAGKSSILRGLHQLQQGLTDPFGDVRVGSTAAIVDMQLTGIPGYAAWLSAAPGGTFTFTATINSNDRRNGSWNGVIKSSSGANNGEIRLPNVEPYHFVVPYLSKRKAAAYHEDIREQFVMTVASDVSNLAAKLSRLANPAYPSHQAYADACRAILGFVVTAIPAPSGQRPGIYLPNGLTIPIEQMGEGVPNIVHLLASLATSTDKLFLVEEPENDLHPVALRSLLDLIIESSASNQFVVSTHSNIVVRHLCSAPSSRLMRVSSRPGVLPTESNVELVPPTPEARFAVLRELGYIFSDLDLWEGWLILEESSAERIVRDYLVPWFVPKLTRVRTVAAGGVDRVAPLLDDFLRLMVFTHLEPVYRGRTWVRIDNDSRGREIIESLRHKYSTWPSDRLATFPSDQFERYYPAAFATRASAILLIDDNAARRTAKRDLLLDVTRWLDEDPERGRIAMLASAAPVIDDLRAIESQLSTT